MRQCSNLLTTRCEQQYTAVYLRLGGDPAERGTRGAGLVRQHVDGCCSASGAVGRSVELRLVALPGIISFDDHMVDLRDCGPLLESGLNNKGSTCSIRRDTMALPDPVGRIRHTTSIAEGGNVASWTDRCRKDGERSSCAPGAMTSPERVSTGQTRSWRHLPPLAQ